MHVAIYLRVSSDEQLDGYSIAAQERACREYAEKQGWTVAGLYVEEGRSGRNDQRPELQRLLADAQAKPRRFKAVIFHNLDRLMRNLRLQLNLKAELDAAGVQLVSVLDHIDTTTPEGIMHFQMKGMLAEWYSNNMGREIQKGYREKARQGGWVGPVPTGYQSSDTGLVPSADAPGIRDCFTLYASGLYSFISLADAMNQRGHRISNIRTGERHSWGKENVRTVLKNPAYRGAVRFQNQEYPGTHPALVSDDLWYACQTLMQQRGSKNGRVSFGDGPRGGMLTEMAYCTCGLRMWYQWSGRPYRSEHGGKYYICSGRTKRCCDAPFTQATRLEHVMHGILDALTVPDTVQQLILSRAEELLAVQQEPSATENHVEIAARLKRLDRLYLNGRIDDDAYEAERSRLERALQAAPAPAPVAFDYAKAVQMVTSVGSLVREAELGAQRALLRTVFDRIWIERQTIVALTPTPIYLPLVATARAVLNMVGWEGVEPSTG